MCQTRALTCPLSSPEREIHRGKWRERPRGKAKETKRYIENRAAEPEAERPRDAELRKIVRWKSREMEKEQQKNTSEDDREKQRKTE